MELMDVIRTRRSVRKFKSDPIPDNVLLEILEAGQLAPSGGNGQDHHFGVIKKEETKRRLAQAAGNQEWIATAPVVIAYCTSIDHDLKDLPEDDFGLIVNQARFGEDLINYLNQYPDRRAVNKLWKNSTPLIPGQHILLAAVNRGLSGCWIGYLDTDQAGEILNLPDNKVCLFLMPLGYPGEEPIEKELKTLEEIVFSEEWGQKPSLLEHGQQDKCQVRIRDYNSLEEEEWLKCWGQVVVTSHAWTLVYQEKPRYQKDSLELVAVEKGEIIGFIDIEIMDTYPGSNQKEEANDQLFGFVWEYGLLPGKRGRGLGRKLIEESAKLAKKKYGINRLEFWSCDPDSQRFYQNYGMEEISRHYQLYIKIDKKIKEYFKENNFLPWHIYGSCKVEELENLKQNYDILEKKPFEAHLCIGFNYQI